MKNVVNDGIKLVKKNWTKNEKKASRQARLSSQPQIEAHKLGSMSIVVVKKIHKVIDNRIMIINDLVKQGRFCMRKREEYAF